MNLRIALSFLFFVLFSFALSAQNKSFTTNLPIFYLNTNGQEIPDDPKIDATLEIAWEGEGETNSTFDPGNHFSGKIGIEIRGSSSQMFPKKSYGFELYDDAGEDLSFPLLDLPEEEVWILYAPYSDKSLLRNVVIFTLASQMSDTYASRCRLVELFLNNEYQGVYVLMEKIKRDDNRVAINKLKEDETSGEDLTGGYIIKIDKETGSGGDGWWSQIPNADNSRSFYQYEYPKPEDIQPEQKKYIQDYIHDFETAVYNLSHDAQYGYQNYMNLETFYDYMIVNEFSRNVDGYRLSTFLNKDKNGKLNAGPIWDYNLAFGNCDFYDAWMTYGLVVFQDIGEDYWQVPFWWKKLAHDSEFKNPMRCRWEELRETVLSEEHIFTVIDSLTSYMGSAVDRNFGRWPVLTQYVWPNYYIGNTYLNEINWMKDWISKRLVRLETELPGKCDLTAQNPASETENSVVFYPNPFRSELILKVDADTNEDCQLNIYSLNGTLIRQLKLALQAGENRMELSFPELSSGVYFYRLTQGDNELNSGKLVKL